MSRANTAGRACAQHNRVLDIQPDVPGFRSIRLSSAHRGPPAGTRSLPPVATRCALRAPAAAARAGCTPPSGGNRFRFRDRVAVNTRYPGPLSPGSLAGSGGYPARYDMEEPMHDHDRTTGTPPATWHRWAPAPAGLTAAAAVLVGGAIAAFAAASGGARQ